MLKAKQVHLLMALAFLNLIFKLDIAEASTLIENNGTARDQRNKTFFYFAFGSNLLDKRILIMNPTARRIGPAALAHYRLDFDQSKDNDNRWFGAVATIVPDYNRTVYGIVWEIDLDQLQNLDKQEGVDEQIYAPLNVSVELLNSDRTNVIARTYYLAGGIREDSKFDRRPSSTYLKCIVKGAQEGQLPIDYIRFLKSIEHNGLKAPDLEQILQLEDFKLNDSEKD